MRDLINNMTKIAALATCACIAQAAIAKPGGEPLVLDTQTGIHSGASGTVLQSAPLGSPGMVPMATLPGIQPQEQPPIVVSPYVEYPGNQSVQPSRPGTGNGGRRYRPTTQTPTP